MEMDKTEPIRLTNWVAAVLAIIVAGVTVYLQSNDWKAAALASLTAAVPLLGAAEVARQKVVSPDTLERETGRTIEQLNSMK